MLEKKNNQVPKLEKSKRLQNIYQYPIKSQELKIVKYTYTNSRTDIKSINAKLE